MADEASSTPTEAPPAPPSSWKLPDGIEDHIESGECRNFKSRWEIGQ
jgi:hypothetical protein